MHTAIKVRCLSPGMQSKIRNINLEYTTDKCDGVLHRTMQEIAHSSSLKRCHRFMTVFTTWSCVFTLQCSLLHPTDFCNISAGTTSGGATSLVLTQQVKHSCINPVQSKRVQQHRHGLCHTLNLRNI